VNKVEVQHLFSETKKKYKMIPEIEFEINSWSVIAAMLKKTDLIGMVPDFVARQDIDKGKLFESIEEVRAPQYSTKIIWLSNKQMPKGAELLLAELKRALVT
jgi:DNA-binding transcriptional LysR family regulator